MFSFISFDSMLCHDVIVVFQIIYKKSVRIWEYDNKSTKWTPGKFRGDVYVYVIFHLPFLIFIKQAEQLNKPRLTTMGLALSRRKRTNYSKK